MTRGRKAYKFGGKTKVLGVRLDQETYEWVKSLGDYGPDLIRSILDEYMMTKDEHAIDRQIDDIKGEIIKHEREALALKERLKELESVKAKLQNSQMDYLRVRQKLVEEYLRAPNEAMFRGWLDSPAHESMISEGKFGSAKEVAEFCRAEVEKRRGRV